jgi:hypothetical protein
VCVRARECVRACVRACVCMRACVCVRACVRARARVCVHAHACVRIRECQRTYNSCAYSSLGDWPRERTNIHPHPHPHPNPNLRLPQLRRRQLPLQFLHLRGVGVRGERARLDVGACLVLRAACACVNALSEPTRLRARKRALSGHPMILTLA